MILSACGSTNPYLYGSPMDMPLFCDKQICSDSCVNSKPQQQQNDLRTIMCSKSYISLLNDVKLHHGILLKTGSQLMFATSKYTNKFVVDISISELIEILDFKCLASYIDLNGKHHDIFLPRLLSNSQYFWKLFDCDKSLTKLDILQFNPSKICQASHCYRWPMPSKPKEWSSIDYELFCDLYVTPEALEAVLLYINYSKINYHGSLRAYVAACCFLQTDSALLFLFECQTIVYDNFLEITKSVLINFGPEHPVFEFLVLYGASNIFSISFLDLLNILALPQDVCHFLCVNRFAKCFEYTNCKFVIDAISDDNMYPNSSVLFTLGNECNSIVQLNRRLKATDKFSCEGLSVFFENHLRNNIVYRNSLRYACIICNSAAFHCPKVSYDGGKSWKNRPGYIPEILTAELTCCKSFVHRTCFHALFCNTSNWFCPYCQARYLGHLRVSRYAFRKKHTFLILKQPYIISPYYIDSWNYSVRVQVCSRPVINNDFMLTQKTSI